MKSEGKIFVYKILNTFYHFSFKVSVIFYRVLMKVCDRKSLSVLGF